MDYDSCFLESNNYARVIYARLSDERMPALAGNWRIHHCKIVTHRLNDVRHFFTKKFLFEESFASTNDAGVVVQRGTARFLLQPSRPPVAEGFIEAVTDVALQVENVDSQVACLVNAGATVLQPAHDIEDKHGRIRIAVVSSIIPSLVHSLIQKDNYASFLPDFEAMPTKRVNSEFIHLDHIAFVTNKGETDAVLSWFERCFGMHRFRVNATEDEQEGFIVKHKDSGKSSDGRQKFSEY